jgi:HdeA/HdeB family
MMRKLLLATGLIMGCAGSSAFAQAELKTYADKDGFLDVQALTCAQLAGTFQEDANLLMTWYSGWYNGLAKKHFINIPRSREAEHEIIVYCKANPNVKVIKAIGLTFDEMRKERGIVLSK